MANLLEIAELSWRQVFPDPTAQTPTKKAEFIAKAKLEYAWQMFLLSKQEKRESGEWEVPSAILRRDTLEVEDNEASIAHLNILRDPTGDSWIQNIGGLGGECSYVRQSVSLSQILSDPDYWGSTRPYVPIGDTIYFPAGTHRKKLPIIYASNGEDLEDNIEVDDVVGAIVGQRLVEIYSAKQIVDVTQNNNPNK